MIGRENDWLNHITWRKVKKIKVFILERQDKRVRRLAILVAIHSFINLVNS